MSELVRVCSCGHPNLESEFFCSKCGADISGINPTASTCAARPPELKDFPQAIPAGMKKCPKCGTLNEGYALVCSCAGCGTELSGTPPTATAPPVEMLRESQNVRGTSVATDAAKTATGRKFVLIAGTQEYECQDGDMFGRDGTVASPVFAAAGGTVSRKHALVTYRDGGWFLASLSPNLTELDGRDLPKNQPSPISAGEHVLRLSTKCVVRLRVE